jgi:hypothetical protein
MRRIALTVVLLLYALALPGGVSAAPDNATATPTANNSTVEDLRERLQQKNATIDEKNQAISDLETQVVEKNARIQELEFQLEQANTTDGFTAREAESLKEVGAWNEETNQPAFMLWVDSEDGGLYVFVGPGNGHHSLNGMTAWQKVVGGDISIAGNITFSLPYAPEGIDKEQKIVNGLDSNAAAEIRQLIERFNQPKTRQAWERWNNEQRQSAESKSLQSAILSHSAILGVGFFLMFIESRKHILFNRRKDKQEQEQRAFFQGEDEEPDSLVAKIAFWR